MRFLRSGKCGTLLTSAFLASGVFCGSTFWEGVFGESAFCAAEGTETVEGPMLMPGHEGKEALQVESSPFEAPGARKRMKGLYADSFLFLQVPRLNENGELIPETDETAEISAVERHFPITVSATFSHFSSLHGFSRTRIITHKIEKSNIF